MDPADGMAAKTEPTERHLSDEKSDPQLRGILEDLQRVNPVEQDDLHSGKRRGSRRFARFLVAICIGVAATLAWQSYSDAAKQIIATRAPELGWSPEAKQMIANWVEQLGWTKPPAGSEKQAAPVAQKAPSTLSLDAEQMQQLTRNLTALQQTMEQLAATQDQMAREITRLQAADTEILAKITPAPPPQPPAAPARKPTPTAPPSSRAAIPPRPAPHP